MRALRVEPEPGVQHLFEAALDQPAAGRRAFLRAACGNQRVIREVEELLAFDAAEQDFLETPAVRLDAPPADEPAGAPTRLGPFVLGRQIGQGGMSTVYLAERSRGEPRRVAVKLMREGLARTPVLRRFQKERRILAQLRHPNIAAFLHGGTSREGLPFVVMEYVPGQGVTDYCDAHRLTVGERIVLFLDVCDAVAYAHRRRVVHRDLKPSNVLVTEEGVVKLLDFGIAKVVGASLLFPPHEETATRERFLTPDYASPEHVAGRDVSVASDVFSLGVMLYELLTGVLPFQSALQARLGLSAAPRSLAGTVTSPGTDGRRSEKLVAALRSTSPEQLCSELEGELEQVVLRAIRLEPEDRQASVAELSQQLGGCLEGRGRLGAARSRPERGSRWFSAGLFSGRAIGRFLGALRRVNGRWQP